ncbi:MAG: RNA-binding domain-containing protein [Candidatus Omnitrophota bacterium]
MRRDKKNQEINVRSETSNRSVGDKEVDLKALISKGESETSEFKTSTGEYKEIIETISAFSNTKGGKIVIGVSKSGKLLGVEVGKDSIERLANQIFQNTDPKVHPRISTEKIKGKSIIIIEVRESSDHLVLAFGRPFKRVGKSTVRMSKDEYERLILEKHKERLYFDSQICKEATLKDIDEEKVRWFLKEAKRQRGLKISEDALLNDVLMRLKLLQDGKLTNAALLLFGKESKFIQSEVKCIRFDGNKPVKPYIDFQTMEGNIFDLVDKTEDFVLRNIKKAIWLIPGQIQREEKHEYPPSAIREAVVNAIVHRDYSSPSKVQIRIFDDYIEIWNPGRLPDGWTVEKLKRKHESIPKNPLLFKQFFWVKYVEDVGGGTLDMINECKNWGIPEPEFEDTATSIVVTFRKSILTPEILTKLGLNERQTGAIGLIKQYGKITTKNYCNLLKIARDTANRDLKGLLGKGIIKKRGSGPQTHYILSNISIGQYRTVSDSKMTKIPQP